VNFRANNHIANLRKDNLFHHDNGFLGERIKGDVNYCPWMIIQLAISLRTIERVKKAKPGVVSSVLTSNDATETKVS
jgi:glucose-1-phosphate adenylyltransferase